MQTPERTERNEGLHDAMWRGHGGWEMALTPAFFGFLGWLLDGSIGTRPVFTIVFAIVVLIGSVCNQYFQYAHRMKVETALRKAALQAVASPKSPFARVEQIQ